MNTNLNILISGGGIAGLALAYWLHKFGFRPVIVEKRPNLEDEGYMIDFYGSGFDIAEKMGLRERLQARHYPVSQLKFVDRHGQSQATFNIQAFRKLLKYRHYNFMRGDLADVLHETVCDDVPIHFGTSITTLTSHDQGVEVGFSDGTSHTYDLVIGADGIHSQTRTLLWGNGDQFESFLGYYVSCGIIENILGDQNTFFGHLEPGKQISVYSIRDNRLATFLAFKSENHGHLTRPQQLDLLDRVFGRAGWIAPQLLEAMKASPHFYFDAVSQVKLNPWYKQRVALVGDSCQCLTLLAGQGASMAMAGAYVLATQLQQSQGDYQVAFEAYQTQMQPEIIQRQAEARKLARSFIPDSELSITLMNIFLRLAFLPGFRSIFLRQIGAKTIVK